MFILPTGAPARLNAWPWIAALGYDDPNRGLIESIFFNILIIFVFAWVKTTPTEIPHFHHQTNNPNPSLVSLPFLVYFVKSIILLIL